jgi:hypothetical protein
MADNNDTLLKDAVFWVSLATITAGLIKFTITYCLKSKCSDFSICFGLLKIKRDVNVEKEIEISQMEHPVEEGHRPVDNV